MHTHRVSLNGQELAVADGHYKLLTMLRSVALHDAHGYPIPSSELVVEGVDATGREVTSFLSSLRLREGDVVQIVIGSQRLPSGLG